MKLPKVKREHLYRLITILAILLTIVFSVYAITNARQYVTRRGVRRVATQLKQFGPFAPIILAGLILISTLIPPLPIPIPFVEVVAGTVFGFLPGFLLVWVTQIISSLAAFYLSKYLSSLFLKRFLESKTFKFYTHFIKRRRALAIFVIRATMISPFNISFLAGMSGMGAVNFLVATIFGVISEAVIFTYLGTLIVSRVRFPLWYVFVALGILSLVSPAFLLLVRLFPRKKPTRS